MYDNRPIGIFDSGLGGLTVVAAIKKILPNENLIYLGDTARVPYGNKSAKSITKFGLDNTNFLKSNDVKLVVIACNSVSAVAIDAIRERYPDIPIIGVIEAGVASCLEHKTANITVIGTRATINSDIYKRSINEVDKSIDVSSIACPLFVPIVEEGILEGSITRDIIRLYLHHLEHTRIEQVLLLGCTHYPLLKKAISEFTSNAVTIIDSAIACAQFTEDYLIRNSSLNLGSRAGQTKFFVTDKPTEFRAQSSRFFGHEIDDILTVEL